MLTLYGDVPGQIYVTYPGIAARLLGPPPQARRNDHRGTELLEFGGAQSDLPQCLGDLGEIARSQDDTEQIQLALGVAKGYAQGQLIGIMRMRREMPYPTKAELRIEAPKAL